jgi:RHS repeat-associated protein
VREYIWLEGMPIAVIDGVDTATPVTYYVHTDHLARPIRMTDAAKAQVWTATWTPWGTAHALSGSAIQNLRFPGQYFLIESGLHYNWHRFYDPTIGRYTQPDPLGFPDGPSRYAYAGNSPLMNVDPDGMTHLLGPTRPQQTPIPVPGGRWYFDNDYPRAPQWWHDMINGLVNMCKRSVGYGGGEDNDDEDCHGRFANEVNRCHQRKWQVTHPDYTRGCLERAADRRSMCFRNGNKPHPDEPPEWGDADEETWRNLKK